MKRYRFEIYRAKDGWRWRLKAANHRIVACSGEAFSSKYSAERAASNVAFVLKYSTIKVVILE